VLFAARQQLESRVLGCAAALGVRVLSIEHNDESLRSTPLYERFVEQWRAVDDNRVQLGFHGTPTENVASICRDGLRSRRRDHAVYVSCTLEVPSLYCKAGRGRVIVCAYLTDPRSAARQLAQDRFGLWSECAARPSQRVCQHGAAKIIATHASEATRHAHSLCALWFTILKLGAFGA
jgi:hypothetical protein